MPVVQFHVYKIFNFQDEMIYVGQTANLHARLRDHAINDWFGMVSESRRLSAPLDMKR